MPAKIKVKIIAGRDLPVMDRASDLTDAFVEVRFGTVCHKTDVFRKSLQPHWDSEWFRFEVDDEDLQDEPLQIRVLDYDTYSAHDAIGKVYVNMNPLLWEGGASEINGWFPLYDTMHGIRGEILVKVKVDLFTDVNRYRQSSCGVRFFGTAGQLEGYSCEAIYGFVEELVVNDDPEYKWIDKIRTPRASNEARQRLFSKLSGELQRKIGIKVLELGGNTVVGYQQCFDLEGESGIVVRGIGTAVCLVSHSDDQHLSPQIHAISPGREPLWFPIPPYLTTAQHGPGSRHTPHHTSTMPHHNTYTGFPANGVVTPNRLAYGHFAFSVPPVNELSSLAKISSSPAKPGSLYQRRSSDSDLSTQPKGLSMTSSGSGGSRSAIKPSVVQPQSIELMEFPFFTLTSFPPGFLVNLCGVVSSRSVKLLDKIHNPDEPETRDAWWLEIRTEIRSHARAMGCHAVIGYNEHTSICDEVIILSAIGTAAIVQQTCQDPQQLAPLDMTLSLDRQTFEKRKLQVDTNLANKMAGISQESSSVCSLCHVPYNKNQVPFPIILSQCAICRRQKVPDVLFTTIEVPDVLAITGRGCFLQARICRPKKEVKGENNAKEISDNLPFMEYDLHKQLINKLKLKGMNTLFGLQIQIVVGETMLVAIACATACHVTAMPSPPFPKLNGKECATTTNKQQTSTLRDRILQAVNRNKELYQLNSNASLNTVTPNASQTDPEYLDEALDGMDLDLSAGNKDTFILEIDDDEDEMGVNLLLDSLPPDDLYLSNTEKLPGLLNTTRNLQMFTRVWRGELRGSRCKEFAKISENLLKSLFFKLRMFIPCILTKLTFDVELPDDDIMQISCTGMCVGLGKPPTVTTLSDSLERQKTLSNELIFSLENEEVVAKGVLSQSVVSKETKTVEYHSAPSSELHNIEVTPLSSVAGGQIQNYLGNLNCFYIRESTTIKENGGIGGFMHSFISEVLAIVRAHVSALNGNALISYKMTECVLQDTPHKNQGQCLVNVCGDVVRVKYGAEEGTLSSNDSAPTPHKTSSSPLRYTSLCRPRTYSATVCQDSGQ